MKYCDDCKVSVHPGYARCPLCHKNLGPAEGDLPYPGRYPVFPKENI